MVKTHTRVWAWRVNNLLLLFRKEYAANSNSILVCIYIQLSSSEYVWFSTKGIVIGLKENRRIGNHG